MWVQGSGDIPRGGGQAEEVSHLFFKQSLLKLVTAGCTSCCPGSFAVHWAGSEHGAGPCVTPPMQNAPREMQGPAFNLLIDRVPLAKSSEPGSLGQAGGLD